MLSLIHYTKEGKPCEEIRDGEVYRWHMYRCPAMKTYISNMYITLCCQLDLKTKLLKIIILIVRERQNRIPLFALCVCVCLYMWACQCHAAQCRSQRTTSGESGLSFYLVLRQGLLSSCQCLLQLAAPERPAFSLYPSLPLCHNSTGITGVHHYIWILTWIPGIKFKLSSLCGKYFCLQLVL